MNTRKAITIMVTLIALILVGTVIVLTTVVQYFGVDSRDIITELEMNMYERLANQATSRREGAASLRAKEQQVVSGGRADPDVVVSKEDKEQSLNEFMHGLDERGWLDSTTEKNLTAQASNREPRIPKIIHATWKTDVLPDRWEKIRQGCIDLHPDYEFMLWSDASSRDFIAEYYPWFLPTFDGYVYPIQRADVIRYFVLHRFGGIYMDLDIGCRRNMDPLLYFQVILPQTIPVGVSNDLMFSEKNHPFMDLVIHNLITFDHTYGTNYPTVMFSTGPMFLSAQYGLWPKDVSEGMERQVRVLPRRWYGKNAPPSQMTDSYFDHYYGSSWHAEDAGFITFLGKFGIALMYAGLALVVLGLARLLWSKRSFLRSSPRILGPIALPYGTPQTGNEALPYIRPDTPGGSRPSTPFDNASQSGRPQSPPSNRPGLLYYLPVWVMPPPERTHDGSGSPGSTDNNWSQYFSNLSFADSQDHANRYHPIPSYSRPPSPSNNSILHAPGSTHDGAFDGVPLHSIQAPAPRSSRPPSSSSSSVPTSSTSSLPQLSTTGPNSPPAYSTLRSVGASLFRPFHAVAAKDPREGFDPEHPESSLLPQFRPREDSVDEHEPEREYFESKQLASRKTLQQDGSATSSGNRHSGRQRSEYEQRLRPRSPSPLPPQYSSAPGAQSRRGSTPGFNGKESDPAARTTTSQGSPSERSETKAEHWTEFSRSAENRHEPQEGDELSDFEPRSRVDSDEYYESDGGVPLETQVDRLLSELTPEPTADPEDKQSSRSS